MVGDAEVSSSSTQGLCNGNIHMNGELEEKEADKNEAEIDKEKVEKTESPTEKTSVEKCEADCARDRKRAGLTNGETYGVSSSTENGKVAAEMDNEISTTSPSKKKATISSVEIYHKLLQYDSSDSEEEDETFVAEPERYNFFSNFKLYCLLLE